MEKIINFPARVQYTKEYLTKNPRVKQRQGIAQRLTRGHEGVVTIEWEGVKSIGHVHLDFLEEVLPATTISMEKNIRLPVEVENRIKTEARKYAEELTFNSAWVNPELIDELKTSAAEDWNAGATAYASKLQEVQQELELADTMLNDAHDLLREVFRTHESGLMPEQMIYHKIKKFLYGE